MTGALLTYCIVIPSAAICLFPMKNQLKYNPRRIIGNMCALFAVVLPLAAFLQCHFALAPNTVLFPLLVPCFAAYHACLRVHISKSLAVFCSVLALMSICGNYAVCFDAARNPLLGADFYTLDYSLFYLGLAAAAAALLYYPLEKYGGRLIDELNLKNIWYMTIPFSALFLCINLFLRPERYETYHVNRVFPMVLLILTALLAVWILLHAVFYCIVSEMLEAAKALERGRLLEMQEKQYIAQQRYMESSARARHDFRQAIRTLQELAKAEDLDAMKTFINRYAESLPEIDAKTYCHDHALNALLNYYANLAEQNRIRMEIKIDLPEAFRVTDTDLCGMTGNILENAITACQKVPEARRELQLKSRAHNDMYFIMVATNTFNGNVRMKNGQYLSMHGRGRGLGLSSIRSTAEKYGGSAEFSHDAEKFYTDIMIPIYENQPFAF